MAEILMRAKALAEPTPKRAALLQLVLSFYLLAAGTAFSQQTRVVVWGINLAGQQDVPASLTNAIAVGVNGYSLVALRADGSVAEWGNGGSDPGTGRSRSGAIRRRRRA